MENENPKNKHSLTYDEKNYVNQLEKNLLILEQDFNSMLIKIQKGMNQVLFLLLKNFISKKF